MKKHAFTLIELLVVVGILALLMAVLVPVLTSADRGAKKLKDQAQIGAIEKALFSWAKSNKEDQFPPVKTDSKGYTYYGGGAVEEFMTLVNDPSTGQLSCTPDPLPPRTFICPLSAFSPMEPYGLNKGYTTPYYNFQSLTDSCSYGVLNGGVLDAGKWKGNNEGRFNNGRAQVPFMCNVLLSDWWKGSGVADWNPVPTFKASDWKGNLGWADGHVKFYGNAKANVVPTVMNGTTYPADDIFLPTVVGPNGDAIMGEALGVGTWASSNTATGVLMDSSNAYGTGYQGY